MFWRRRGEKFVRIGGIFTDLYELTMAQSYYYEGETKEAVFDFFIREREGTPRRYYVFAGLEFLLEFLENFHFTTEDIKYLENLGLFKKDFLDYIKDLRFEGEVLAVDEGRIVFPGEPIIEVVAPIPQVQIIETALINLVQFSTLVATKSARCYSVSGGKMLIDFGARRAHSPGSAEMAARASYIAGFIGTSLLSAGEKYEIPVYGTMAHSYIMIHESEEIAFEKFARLYNGTVLLVDTYNTEEGVRKAVKVIKKLKEEGIKVRGIRIDSGNIADEVRKAREILNEEGLDDVFIFISGGLNEYIIKELIDRNIPVDGFGVGSELTTSADMPYLDCAFKLVEYDGKPRIKLSEGKKTIPGRKKVKRLYKNGKMVADIITPYSDEDDMPDTPIDHDRSEIILKKFMEKGKIKDEIRDMIYKRKKEYLLKCRHNFLLDLKALPEHLKELSPPGKEDEKYKVIFGKKFGKMVQETEKLFS